MKIRYASDIHIEFDRAGCPDYLEPIGEDVVVLAGDIGVGTEGIRWAAKVYANRPVLYLLGNHEFYGYGWDTLIQEARDAAAATPNVRILENNTVFINHVRFIGCTLWTDFNALGNPARAMLLARNAMTDYRAIQVSRTPPRLIRPEHVQARCLASREWLARELNASDVPTVVVTHMAPSADDRLANPEFIGDPLQPAFHNAFDELIAPPALAWIFGHHHHSLDETMNGVSVVSNQRGYPHEDCGFSWDRLLEINAPAYSWPAAAPTDGYTGVYLRLADDGEDPRGCEDRLHRLCVYTILTGEAAYNGFEADLFRLAASLIEDAYPGAAIQLREAAKPYLFEQGDHLEESRSAVVDDFRFRKRLMRRLGEALRPKR